MEFNTERLKDAIDAGNFNAIIPLLNLSIKNNKGLDFDTQKQAMKYLKRIQYILIQRGWMPTFQEEA